MRKKYILLSVICTIIFTVVFCIGEARVQYSFQPPFNYTGAEGSTCAQCHGNLNTGGGSVLTSGLPVGNFVKGQTYNFSVTIAHPEVRGRWGFSIGARDANNQPVGTFTESNPNAALNVNELSHYMAVFQTGQSFTYDSLKWTAPANPTNAQKTVTFYYVGNAANGNMGSTGDFIYSGTKSVVLAPPNQAPVVSITSPSPNSSVPAAGLVSLNATASDADGAVSKVIFYNHGIKFLEDSTAPYGTISNHEIEPGNYALTAKAFDNKGDSTISDTVKFTVTTCVPTGAVTGEGYTNIPGSQVADLTNNPAYPNNPGVTVQLGSLEFNNVGDNYGSRLSGYLCAPFTGNYTFYIAGDDQAGLFLSPDADPAGKVLIAYNETPVAFREWFRFATQKSKPVRLIKGARYYFETLHKQSSGANHLSVAWLLPDGAAEIPIPGNRLSPAKSNGQRVTAQSFTEAMSASPLKLIVKATPNPSDSYFTVSIHSNSNAPVTLLLTDMLGKIVERKENIITNGTLQLGTRLQPGIYFLEVTQGVQKERLKLIRKQ